MVSDFSFLFSNVCVLHVKTYELGTCLLTMYLEKKAVMPRDELKNLPYESLYCLEKQLQEIR